MDKDGRPPAEGGMTDTRKETEEILNSILPPRCWDEDGQMWTQTVSSVPATRQDVINLQEMLDTRLQQTQARETGICPVRRDLYTQCFGGYWYIVIIWIEKFSLTNTHCFYSQLVFDFRRRINSPSNN